MIVNGIEISVTRKNIKNVHLYVKPPEGRVEITCPLHFSDEQAEFFARTKIGWIRQKQEEFLSHPRQTERKYVTGETIYVWGQPYYLKVKSVPKEYAIEFTGRTMVFSVRKGSDANQRANFINEWYRAQLKSEIDLRLPEWEEKTGLKSSCYKVQKMSSRWGSCNYGTKGLLFNLQLAQKPKICLNYIILHELAHTVEKTHNGKFITILDKYMPNWREIKQTLNSLISSPWED